MQPINIAVIGCGAAGVTFIRLFLEKALKANFNRFNITIFERAKQFGVGVAYQPDLHNLLINRPLQTSAAHPFKLNEFDSWLKHNKKLLNHMIIESNHNNDKRAYISRKIFGYYLQDMLQKTIKKAKNNMVKINLVNQEAIKMYNTHPYTIEVVSREIYLADYVVICTGINQPEDFYKLGNTPNYIHFPYPLLNTLMYIKPHESVGIIGNSLTAIDIASSLQVLGHTGPIDMLTKVLMYPRVRGKIRPHKMAFLTKKNILNIIKKKTSLTLRDILRLFRKELKQFSYKWQELFKEDSAETNFLDYLTKEINQAQHERKHQSILLKTNTIIEDCWHALDRQSKEIFMRLFHRPWLNNRSPIPLKNAKTLQQMVKAGQLTVIGGLDTLQYKNKQKKYLAKTENRLRKTYDWIINATGPAKYVTQQNKLLYSLVQTGITKDNNFGGLEVDFATNAVIDKNEHANPAIRLIGHNTSGVHYYTSSLEMIAKRSDIVANTLLEFILKSEKNHD